MPFPERDRITGTATAPFNIWRDGGVEVLMIPVVYSVLSTVEIWVLAFSSTGGFLADALVSRFQGEVVEAGSWDWLPPYRNVRGMLVPKVPSYPSVAIFTNPQGGTPWVLVSDRNHHLVGYTFALEGNAGRFTEGFRFQDTERNFWAPPMVLPDGYTRMGTVQGPLLFAPPNGIRMSPIDGSEPIYASPTRTADGRLVVVTGEGTMSVLRDASVLSRTKLPQGVEASPAASFDHVFVATGNALLTYDASTMAEVQQFPWENGGSWPPVIGPQGHVYAIANNILRVFHPPRHVRPLDWRP
jgi:hypothetical protein